MHSNIPRLTCKMQFILTLLTFRLKLELNHNRIETWSKSILLGLPRHVNSPITSNIPTGVFMAGFFSSICCSLRWTDVASTELQRCHPYTVFWQCLFIFCTVLSHNYGHILQITRLMHYAYAPQARSLIKNRGCECCSLPPPAQKSVNASQISAKSKKGGGDVPTKQERGESKWFIKGPH